MQQQQPNFTFIYESQCSQDLDLPNISTLGHPVPNLAHIQGVVVTFTLCVGIDVSWILPSLGKGSVIPDITMVREAVIYKTKLLFLDILFYRIEGL